MQQAATVTETPADIMVCGEKLTTLPDDLYIPPEALRVFLEAFQGPLDLLLYLIRKQHFDILDIPIAAITEQYMQYIDLMKETQLELAAEYLLMAAMLAEIKSRMLLPRPASGDDEDPDPRVELVRRLQEYERYKKAAFDLDTLPRMNRDTFVAAATRPPMKLDHSESTIELPEILAALKGVLERAVLNKDHRVIAEPLSIRERMSIVLSTVRSEQFTAFTDLFTVKEGRMGVVVTLIAILELIRQSMIELVQNEAFAPIYVKGKE